MRPKLILHAGTHKTGTTAIQAFAARHRDALAARGLLYPDLSPLGRQHNFPHHLFAHALAGAEATLPAAEAVRLAGLWAEAAAARNAAVLISSEPLYRHVLRPENGVRNRRAARAAYLDRLAAALAPFEVEVVLVFRRPEDFVRSLFQENVMRSTAAKWTSFADFRAHAFGGPLRYAENAALFAERFARTRVLIYEDLPSGAGFCRAFFAEIGVDIAGLPPAKTMRASFGAVETQVKILLQQATRDPAAQIRMTKFARSRAAAALTAKHLGPGPFGLWESAAAREAFRAATAPETERLRAAFFPERARLFPPGPEEIPPPTPAFDPALTAELLRQFHRSTPAAAARPADAGATKTPRPKKPRQAAAAPDAEARAPQDAPELPPELPAPRKARRRKAAAPDAPARPAPPIADFVLIIGAMKSGTTSLYHYLAAHPRIAGCRAKEPNFFADVRKRSRGAAKYYALWPDFDPATHRYALEASTNYTKFPQHRGVAHRIKAFAAREGVRFKLIYILRDPADRIESHLAHNIARGRVASDPGEDTMARALEISRYARQLDRYARLFPPKDLLVLDFDDLRADPRALVARCLAFLGLEPPAEFDGAVPSNPRRDANGSAEFRLDAGRRAAIRAELREDVTALRDRYGVDVSGWGVL